MAYERSQVSAGSNANANHLTPHCTASTNVNSRWMSNTPVSDSGPHLSSKHHPTVAHRVSTSHEANQGTPYGSSILSKYSDDVTAGPDDVIDGPADTECYKASQSQAKVSSDMMSAVQKAALLSKAVTPLEAFALAHALAARLASTGGFHWRHCPGGPVVVQDSAAVHSS